MQAQSYFSNTSKKALLSTQILFLPWLSYLLKIALRAKVVIAYVPSLAKPNLARLGIVLPKNKQN